MERSKTLPRKEKILSTRENFNRGYDTTRTDDKDKLISVGLMDIDAAIMYYFNEVIKPTVTDNNEVVKVPIYYANPERWKIIQKNGFLRDVKGQMITPLIIFKRTSVNKDTNNTFLARSISPASSNYTFIKDIQKKIDLHKLPNYLKMMNH